MALTVQGLSKPCSRWQCVGLPASYAPPPQPYPNPLFSHSPTHIAPTSGALAQVRLVGAAGERELEGQLLRRCLQRATQLGLPQLQVATASFVWAARVLRSERSAGRGRELAERGGRPGECL